MAQAKLSELTYWYPDAQRPALRQVSLALEHGLTLVVGASGSGKSTLLRCLNGLVPHFHGGRISGGGEVAGLPIPATHTRRLARSVGFVFQDPEAQAAYSVVEREVAFGPENLGLSRAEMRARVGDALERMGLTRLRERRLATLSGGERQRVALASALAMGPELLVLDEPTSQLDPAGAASLLAACRQLAEQGCSLVVSEHRVNGLSDLAGTQLLVEDGIVSLGNTSAADEWQAPQPPPGRAAAERDGTVSWALEAVSAGHARRAVLEGVDLVGRRGQVTVLRGPNGAGKTTLLRTIAGLLPPLAGRVERGPGRVACLPQNPQDVLHLPTVRQELELTIRRTKSYDDGVEVLDRLGLRDLAERYPRDLSSGERQRAAIAAILAGGPDIALLDEPTRGMDGPARTALVEMVLALRAGGSSLVLATHDRRLAAAVADQVVEIDGGAARPTPDAEVAAR